MRDALLARFPGARRDVNGFTAKCPAHDDRRASLSLSEGDDGRVLLHCHAGCTVTEVLAAADLTLADLFPDSKPSRSIADVYAYRDEGGKHVFDVVRFDPKDFRQRRADGIWNMAGVRRVLYHLDRLQGQSVAYAVEGEKDADRLRALNFPATTSPGGAGKWRPEYAQQLRAAAVEHVVVLPDNDEAGRAHAEAVAVSCHAAGLKAKIVTLPNLPEKGDVSDWLDAGHGKTDLVALVKAAPIWTPHVGSAPRAPGGDGLTLTAIGDLLAEPEETVDWLVEDRIPAGAVAVMASKPKVGKSTAARALAVAVARGGDWLGHRCAAGKVWYLAFEGRRRDIRAHFRQLGARPDDALRVFVGQAPRDVVPMVRRLADQERPALIIVDTMQRFLRAQSTDDYAEMTTLLDAVIGVAQNTGATMLLLHHSGKADRASLDAVLGSTAITGSADTIILLARHDRYRTISTVQRTGHDLDETVIRLDQQTGCVTLGPNRHEADEVLVANAIVTALQNAGKPLTEAQIEDVVDARTSIKRRALRQLVAREQVSRTGRGGKCDPFHYAVSCSRSLVPIYMGEQENNNRSLTVSPREVVPDSCSHVPERVRVPEDHDERL